MGTIQDKRFNKIFQIGFNKCGTRSMHNFFIDLGLKSFHKWEKLSPTIQTNIKNNECLLKGVDDYDCFLDCVEILDNYKLLDLQYPNSLFILNTRNRDDWITSRLTHDWVFYCRAIHKPNDLNHKIKNMTMRNKILFIVQTWNQEIKKNQKVFDDYWVNDQSAIWVRFEYIKHTKRNRIKYSIKEILSLVAMWEREWDKHHQDVLAYFTNRVHFVVFDIEHEQQKLIDFLQDWGLSINVKFPHAHNSKNSNSILNMKKEKL
jgi:hypothetical protein